MNENVNIVSSGEAHDKCLPRDSIFSSSALLQSSVSGRRTARGMRRLQRDDVAGDGGRGCSASYSEHPATLEIILAPLPQRWRAGGARGTQPARMPRRRVLLRRRHGPDVWRVLPLPLRRRRRRCDEVISAGVWREFTTSIRVIGWWWRQTADFTDDVISLAIQRWRRRALCLCILCHVVSSEGQCSRCTQPIGIHCSGCIILPRHDR